MEFDTTALLFAFMCAIGFTIVGLLIRIVSLHELKNMNEEELHALARGLYGRRFDDKRKKYDIDHQPQDRIH